MPPLSTDYVFMSYSRRDDVVMRRIVTFLREQGIKVWVDNEKLIPGTPVWEKEIEKAVQGASAVVVVLSPDSKDSEWVRREISLADQYEKRVFPLLVRGDEKTSISIRLIGRQYVDIRSNEDAGLNYVSATLLRYLEELNEREQNAKKEADRFAAQKIKTEKRLAARKAEEERIALEKIATERKAKEEADRLSAQKIEEERITQEKAQADRKAKEDADRLIAQKAEEERIALEKVAADRKAKEDADRLIAQKAEEERIALEKVVAERKTKEDADRLSAQKLELDSKEKLARENTEREAREKLAREKLERDAREKEKRETKAESTVEKPVVTKFETKKHSGMKLPLWGIGLVAFSVLALIVWGLSSLPASPKANPTSATTQTLFVEPATETLVPSTSTPQPTETIPVLRVGSTEISPKDGMTLLYVPAGEFLMGSTDTDTDASSSEKPQHPVSLDAFWIDQTEVTNKMFSAFVSATGYKTDAEMAGSSYVYNGSNWILANGADWQHPAGPTSDISGKEKHPVIHVSWNDATEYCKWADRKLPTEAEWEKAARGPNANIYPWGNTFDGTAVNFCDVNCSFDWADKSFNDGYADVSPVGNFPSGQSAYGAYDMAGNVWEWVNDWYDVYPGGDPAASADFGQKYRVLRGGSWVNYDSIVCSALRNRSDPSDSGSYLGFRCSRSP